MALSNTRLERQILAALRTAHMDAQWDAAEHLFCALEALPNDTFLDISLARAYSLIARRSTPLRPDRNRCGTLDGRGGKRR